MFGPDGRLCACHGGAKRIVAYDVSKSNDSAGGTPKEATIAECIECNDLAIRGDGSM